jgi:hypothetical protein
MKKLVALRAATLSVLAAMAAVALAGCGSSEPRPRIALQPCATLLKNKPKVVKKTAMGATIRIPVQFTNPNKVAVRLDSVSYGVTLNSSDLGRALGSPGVTIAPQADASVAVDFEFSVIGAGLAVIEAIGKEDAAWRLAGEATISCADGAYDADDLSFAVKLP